MGETRDPSEIRRALRAELERRGYDVASDSHGLRNELYIIGERDLARALFEFKSSAAEACETMYQGAWVEGMPTRFAVLPAAERTSPSLEMLEQFRVVALFYEATGEDIVFPELDELLAAHLGG